MQRNRTSRTSRNLSFLIVAVILLLSVFQLGGLRSARAQELPPGAPTPLAPKTPPPGVDLLAADVSVTATADSYEPDDSQTALDGNLSDVPLTSGVAQTHSISPIGDIDFVKFVLTGTSSITLQVTPGSWLDDTEMWLYDSGGNLLDYNDDKNPVVSQSYIQRCGPTALPAGTYYAAVEKRGNDTEIASYDITFTINPAGPTSCIPNTTVKVNTQTKGSYWVHPETSTLRSYPVNGAPVQVTTLDHVKPLVASMGVSLKKTTSYESYSEFIGVPGARLTDTYWFPWYSNSGGYVSQLCFGNVGSAGTSVKVTIAGVQKGGYWLALNRAKCVSYAGLNTGPVQVKSSNSVPIVASLNTRVKSTAGFASYAEFGGLSASDTASTDYMFPWYNNLTSGKVISQLRVANIGSSDTTVTVTAGGVTLPTSYPLAANHSTVTPISLGSLNTGPIHVLSSLGVPISASMIVKLKGTAAYTSYTEVMGLPEPSTLTETRVVFPWYNNNTYVSHLVSQLRITNVGKTTTNVTVTIAGSTKEKVSLNARQSKIVSYASVSNGPVVLQSSGGVPIIASMITFINRGVGYNSYSEFVGQPGLPGNQLQPSAWFPWYGNASTGSFFSQLRLGLPAKP